MRVDLFDFDLPESCIAQAPVFPRDAAKLLHVCGDGALSDVGVRDLPRLLQPGDVMVFNNTKVIPARLYGVKQGAEDGRRFEILLHQPVSGAVNQWRAFGRPAKKLKEGDTLFFADGFSAQLMQKQDDGQLILDFGAGDLFAKLKAYGEMPLPPYIARPDGSTEEDADRYQTISAQHEGAVAAPTAGLHFTDALFEALDARGVERRYVTLHVGAGTFQPVKVEDTDAHVMHSEWASLKPEDAKALRDAKAEGRRIVAVGTTSMRTLESAAHATGDIQPFEGETDIFITPGFEFKAVDVLMTNFHLPKSTLFMLVSAFSGREAMLNAYKHAIASDYRFYSYGDACLLERA